MEQGMFAAIKTPFLFVSNKWQFYKMLHKCRTNIGGLKKYLTPVFFAFFLLLISWKNSAIADINTINNSCECNTSLLEHSEKEALPQQGNMEEKSTQFKLQDTPLLTDSDFYLVADIGGTNARFALVSSGSIELQSVKSYKVKNYSSFEDALKAYLQDYNINKIAGACIAVAGPVSGDHAKLTNGLWFFNKAELCQQLSCDNVLLINDFIAQAMSATCLTDDQMVSVGDIRETDLDAPALVVGAGTGLGQAILIKNRDGWQAYATEAGHTDFSPISTADIALWNNKCCLLQPQSWEDFLSGRGLELMYKIYMDITENTYGKEPLSANDIIETALADEHSLAFIVVQHFLDLVARFTGNMALACGAKGGIYIGGGIVPRFLEILDHKAFRFNFENNKRMQNYLKSIPVWIITAKEPGLTGAAVMSNQTFAAHNK